MIWIKLTLFLCFSSLFIVLASDPTTTTTRAPPVPFQYSSGNDPAVNWVNAGTTIGSIIGGGSPIGAAIGGILGWVACIIFCEDPEPPDTTPPNIICPVVNSPVYTPAGSREAVVEYPVAQAQDSEGIDRVGQFFPSNLQSGSSFPAGDYTVAFIAYDNNGNSATCEFSFTVEAPTCYYPERPDDGDVSCPDTPPGLLPVYGESCTFTCDIGYDLIGQETQTCGTVGSYPGGGPVTCQITTCGEPSLPSNAVLDTCTAEYDYDSVCVFVCEEGFALAAGADRSIRCGAEEVWIGMPQGCVDSESPVIENCPETQTVHIGANLNYALATWDVPTATDNVDETVVVSLMEGLPPGSQFYLEPDNVYQIVYGAEDSAGNVAVDCEFSIIVQEIICPPIQHAFRLNISCPDRLTYGARCAFQCDTGYPLIGPTEVYCERTLEDPPTGYWDWGFNMSSPYCEVILCPDLEPPENGALACDNWINGLYCQMQCNAEYDIPRTAPTDGEFVCADTQGTWRPHDNVPDCSVTRRGDSMRLPSELFYFSGDCTSAEAQQEIRENFIEQLQQSDYREICTLYPDCSVDNVNVTCGPVSSRRKRDAAEKTGDRVKRESYDYEAIITFDFILTGVYDPSLTFEEMDENSYAQFVDLAVYFRNLVDDGFMDLAGLEVISDSFRYAESLIICETGAIAEYTTFTCRPCPTGTFYDVANDNCTYCPIGTYQDTDGALHCIDCPQHHSTEDTGARSIEECIMKCQPGQYSSNGLSPCASCAVNTYTDQEMQDSCQSCPNSTYTATIGSDSILDCVTNIIPGGPCSTNPCGSHGVCTRRDGSYVCHCSDGYSGDNCEIPPDPCDVHVCQNGAACVPTGSGEDDYTCQCSDNFAGDLCQHQKVNGQWGVWSSWSTCSSSCGDGEQQRYRRCDSPFPNFYGDYCTGSNSSTQACNLMDCPECPELERPYGARLICSDDGFTKSCTISCREGNTPNKNSPSTLECSPATDYNWSPNVASRDLPTCSESRFPRRASESLRLEVPDAPEPSESDRAEIENNMVSVVTEQAECVTTTQCEVQVAVESESRRKKRSSSLVITIEINADLGEYDYLEGGEYNNETATEGLVNIAWFITQLENVAVALNNSVNDGSLTIIINGEEYTASSLEIDANMECSAGESLFHLLCVNCPPGSYGDGVECTLCPLGEYQSLEGQASCDVCDDGYTSSYLGATDVSECVLQTDENTDENSGDDDSENDDDDDDDDDDDGDDDDGYDDDDDDDTSDEGGNAGNTDSQTGKKKKSGSSKDTAITVSVVVVVAVVAAVIIIVAVYIIKKKKKEPVFRSRRNSEVAPYGPRSDPVLSARAVEIQKLPPPSYEESVFRPELDDNLINAKRHQSLPPLDHAFTKQTLAKQIKATAPPYTEEPL